MAPFVSFLNGAVAMACFAFGAIDGFVNFDFAAGIEREHVQQPAQSDGRRPALDQ